MQYVDTLVCSAPGTLVLEKRPAPERAPEHTLVRPRRIGICGTDYHIFEGKHPFLNYPRVIGHELAVEVVEPDPESPLPAGTLCVVNPYLSCGHCIACRAGKPNCCVSISVLGVHEDGGMAGLLSVPTGNLIAAPGLTADECATVEFLAIGAHAVGRGGVTGRDRVLVVGAGPIGLGTALFASLAGGRVTIFDMDPDRTAAARSMLGLDGLPASDDPLAAAAAVTDGEGFDVVFDATGNRRAMQTGFGFVAHGGRYVLVGVVKEEITFADPDFHRKEMSLFGSRNATSADFRRVLAALGEGRIPVAAIITHRTSLAGAVRDIPLWATEKTGLIKALVEIEG